MVNDRKFDKKVAIDKVTDMMTKLTGNIQQDDIAFKNERSTS